MMEQNKKKLKCLSNGSNLTPLGFIIKANKFFNICSKKIKLSSRHSHLRNNKFEVNLDIYISSFAILKPIITLTTEMQILNSN